MSAKGSNSVPADRYYTPRWAVRQCIDIVLPKVLPRHRMEDSVILEPSAGTGRFVSALGKTGAEVVAVEPDGLNLEGADFMAHSFTGTLEAFQDLEGQVSGQCFDAAVGNPPFSLAAEHVELCLRMSPVVVFLLRLGFLTSAERAKWMETHRPKHVALLRHRPKFGVPDWWVLQREEEERMKGKTWKWGGDSADYAFFVWTREHLEASTSTLSWLPEVSAEERNNDA